MRSSRWVRKVIPFDAVFFRNRTARDLVRPMDRSDTRGSGVGVPTRGPVQSTWTRPLNPCYAWKASPRDSPDSMPVLSKFYGIVIRMAFVRALGRASTPCTARGRSSLGSRPCASFRVTRPIASAAWCSTGPFSINPNCSMTRTAARSRCRLCRSRRWSDSKPYQLEELTDSPLDVGTSDLAGARQAEVLTTEGRHDATVDHGAAQIGLYRSGVSRQVADEPADE